MHRKTGWTMIAAGLLAAGCSGTPPATGPTPPAGSYRAWVTSESADELTLVGYGRDGGEVIAMRPVGSMPVEIDGPHGVAASPDGRFAYVSIGHGLPFGSLWKIDAETLEVLERTTLGLFPATVSVTPDGTYAFISNFNLHGDRVPSSISMVHLGTMAEVARIETCVLPHGSRVNPQGTKHYSVCVQDQLVVEIDIPSGSISRLFSVNPEAFGPLAVGSEPAAPNPNNLCNPTWAEPSADGSHVYVTCNRNSEVLELDAESWTLTRRFPTGNAPYNLGVTPDGRYLLASLRNREDAAVEVIDLAAGSMAAHIPTTTTLVHGIAVSADSRVAFVSVEGVGSEPGKVDVIDLGSLQRVASIPVGQQATGIAIAP